jgi:predicted phosphohydrolase
LELAQRVCESDADAFVIAGDVADINLENFEACLRVFDAFKGLKLLVPGNHDLWTTSGSSMEKYQTLLPRIAEACGFSMLDAGPAVLGDAAFIGNIGWYDYSFRNPEMGLSTEDYRYKALPGVCSWNDSIYINWDLDDEEFTEMCLRKLRQHYSQVEPRVKRVVAVLHHVPFAELLYGPSSRPLEFCRAYLGSERFGHLLLRCEKVRYVICGHRHGRDGFHKGKLRAFVVGSEYETKSLMELDLRSGEHSYIDFRPAPQTAQS